MTEASWTWTLHEKIPSSLKIAHQYLDRFLKALTEAGWDGDDFFHVQMASEEALVNAVTHGNKESTDKQVEIEWMVSPEMVHMRIKDEGEGFNPDTIPDPRSDERLTQVHGRGVWLIRELMSEATWLGRGNEVVLVRYRGDPRFQEVGDDDDDFFTED